MQQPIVDFNTAGLSTLLDIAYNLSDPNLWIVDVFEDKELQYQLGLNKLKTDIHLSDLALILLMVSEQHSAL